MSGRERPFVTGVNGPATLVRPALIPCPAPDRYAWELVTPTDPDYMQHARRPLHAVADRAGWQAALNEARRRASLSGCDPSASKEAA
jgi:hypothetical protein